MCCQWHAPPSLWRHAWKTGSEEMETREPTRRKRAHTATLDSSYLAHVCGARPRAGRGELTGGEGLSSLPLALTAELTKSWTSIFTVPYCTCTVLCMVHTHVLLHASQRKSAPVPPPPLPWYDPIPLAAANTSPLGRCRRCHERVISLYRPPKSTPPVQCSPVCGTPDSPNCQASLARLVLGLCNQLAGPPPSTSVN